MSGRYFLAALMVLGMLLVPLAIAPKVQGGAPPPCLALATICWNNSSGGSWETVANWILPGGTLANRLPTASDDVVLPPLLPSSYTVTISSVQTVHSILVGPGTALTCSSTCTLTIKSHTPASVAFIIGGGLIGVVGFTPAVPLGSADIYGVLNIDGNVVNDASLVDGSVNSIHIDAGGTFVNVNSLDVTNGYLQNNGVFVGKCGSLLTPTPPGQNFGGSGTYITESPCPTQVPTASGSQVSGTASFSSDLGGFTSLTATAVSSVSPAPPVGLTFPAGLFSYTISGLQVGGTVTVTITLPSALPAGTFSYWKFHGGTWSQLPASQASLDSTRTVITLTLTDGATPDDSDGLANGVLVDPGGPGVTFDFSISNSGGVTVVAGGSGSSTITLTLTGGTGMAVLLSASGFPSGASGGFGASSVTPTGASVLTVTTSPSTPVGAYMITVTGSGGGQMHTTTFTLQVNAPAIVPEYPLGLPLLAIFMILAYGLIKRRTRDPQNI